MGTPVIMVLCPDYCKLDLPAGHDPQAITIRGVVTGWDGKFLTADYEGRNTESFYAWAEPEDVFPATPKGEKRAEARRLEVKAHNKLVDLEHEVEKLQGIGVAHAESAEKFRAGFQMLTKRGQWACGKALGVKGLPTLAACESAWSKAVKGADETARKVARVDVVKRWKAAKEELAKRTA